MYSDSILAVTVAASDVLLPRRLSNPVSRNITMSRYQERLQCILARAGFFAAAFVMSSALLGAVGVAFHSVSRDPVLADSPRARVDVASCNVSGDRSARQRCVQRLLAAAKERDSGAARVAALAASRSGTRP